MGSGIRAGCVIGMLILLAAAALADGKSWRVDVTGLLPLQQDAQAAIIHHIDGVQRMLIAINVSLDPNDAGLWIFPVRGTPDATQVELVDHFPWPSSRDPVAEAREKLKRMSTLVSGMAFPCVQLLPSLSRNLDMAYVLHAETSRWGLRSAIVASAAPAGLAAFVQDRVPAATGGDLAAFAPYCNEEHVFVVTWLESRDHALAEFPAIEAGRRATKQRWPTVYVTFPTRRPWYPMRPTADYGDVPLRLRLAIFGHYRLSTERHLERLIEGQARLVDEAPADLPSSLAERLPAADIPVTIYHAYEQARIFTADFEFEVTSRPASWDRAAMAVWWLTGPRAFVVWAVSVLVLGYLAAGAAGVVVYGKWARPALAGLCLIGSVMLLLVELRHLPKFAREAHKVRPGWRPRMIFAIVTCALFAVLVRGVFAIVRMPLG